MTRIAFCDDDAALLHQMQDFLEQYRTLRGVQLELFPYTKPMELLADIEAGVRFDVLFLDVLMPGINGINAAREIRRYDTAVQIIFVTSSSEFAVQSYVVGAYYYQLKPIWKDSFFRLTDAVLAKCRKRTQHSLILRCKSGVTRITLDSLEYCEVQGRTLVFHLLDGTVIESSGSMDELARQLADYPGFLRPHRSYLVNMEYIQNITAKSITMESLAEVPLPHVRRSAPSAGRAKSAGRWRAAPPGCWRCRECSTLVPAPRLPSIFTRLSPICRCISCWCCSAGRRSGRWWQCSRLICAVRCGAGRRWR